MTDDIDKKDQENPDDNIQDDVVSDDDLDALLNDDDLDIDSLTLDGEEIEPQGVEEPTISAETEGEVEEETAPSAPDTPQPEATTEATDDAVIDDELSDLLEEDIDDDLSDLPDELEEAENDVVVAEEEPQEEDVKQVVEETPLNQVDVEPEVSESVADDSEIDIEDEILSVDDSDEEDLTVSSDEDSVVTESLPKKPGFVATLKKRVKQLALLVVLGGVVYTGFVLYTSNNSPSVPEKPQNQVASDNKLKSLGVTDSQETKAVPPMPNPIGREESVSQRTRDRRRFLNETTKSSEAVTQSELPAPTQEPDEPPRFDRKSAANSETESTGKVDKIAEAIEAQKKAKAEEEAAKEEEIAEMPSFGELRGRADIEQERTDNKLAKEEVSPQQRAEKPSSETAAKGPTPTVSPQIEQRLEMNSRRLSNLATTLEKLEAQLNQVNSKLQNRADTPRLKEIEKEFSSLKQELNSLKGQEPAPNVRTKRETNSTQKSDKTASKPKVVQAVPLKRVPESVAKKPSQFTLSQVEDMSETNTQAAVSEEKSEAETPTISAETPSLSPYAKASGVAETRAVKWRLRAAQPGSAWLSKEGETAIQQFNIGDTVEGIGVVQSVDIEGGSWVVRGTNGKIGQ